MAVLRNIKIEFKCIDKMSEPLMYSLRRIFFMDLEEDLKPSIEWLLS